MRTVSGKSSSCPGDYIAHTHNFVGGDIDVPFTHNGEPSMVELAQPVAATVRVDVRDSDGMALGAKVLLEGEGTVIRFVVGNEAIQLPAGMWTATITRGWYYSVFQTALDLEPGSTTDLDAVLEEEIQRYLVLPRVVSARKPELR